MTFARWRWPLFVLIVMAAALASLRSVDRAPVSVRDSDTEGFSAQRAYAHLESLLRENTPHPAGSEANRVIEERIVATLRKLGYQSELQEGLKCSTLAPGCSVVRNIIAVRAGRDPAEAILLTTHYDSVPGSAAAADDGAGVATLLDIAELLSKRPPLLHDVVLLFTDAEETGLRGAMLFADAHPLIKRIGLAVNLEARGVTGPSAMFETSADNAGLIRLFADATERPVANSLLFEVYRRMPNNTDYTVYKNRSVRGLNFAFSRGVALYHSVRDDAAHLDLASLQHHGDNMWGVVLRAGETPLSQLDAAGDATYFDIAGRTLIAWPAGWNVALAAVALLLVVALSIGSAPVRWRTAGWSVLALLVLVVFMPALGWLLSWPLGRWPDIHPLDHPYPWPGRIALIAAAVLATLASALWFGRRAGFAAMLSVVWGLFAVLALIAALTISGVTYAFLAPLYIYVVIGLVEWGVRRDRTRPPIIAAAAGFAAAAYMGLYHFQLADIVLNFHLGHFKILPLLLLSLPLAPLAVAIVNDGAARGSLATLAAVCVVAALSGLLAPAHTADRPRAVNLVHVEDDGRAQWQLQSFGNAGADVVAAMGFDANKETTHRYGVTPMDAHVKPASLQGVPKPVIESVDILESEGARVIRGAVRSTRDAYQLLLAFPAGAGVSRVLIEGQPVLDKPSDKPQVVGLHGVGRTPIRFEITASAGKPLDLIALDLAPLAATPEAGAILARRPSHAAAIHYGDHSIAMNRLQL